MKFKLCEFNQIHNTIKIILYVQNNLPTIIQLIIKIKRNKFDLAFNY